MKKAYVNYGAPSSKIVHILGVPEEEKLREGESLFEGTVAESIPNLAWETDIQVHETHRSTNRFHSGGLYGTDYNKTFKSQRILKAAREKFFQYKETLIKLSDT